MSVGAFPQPFGRYLLDSKLASGGMGEVFLARMAGPAGFEKRVVIKRVLPHLAEAPEFVERFLDEGRLVVRLSHGNIAQVLDMGEVDGQYFMAIEHVDGLDLRELLRRLGTTRLPVPTALAIVVEVAKGLDYAHGRVDDNGRNLGIIHRDVSPSNVVISKSGDVKLLDFGIAVANDRRVHSVSGTLHGKFLYMSPEQASGRPLDRRSDLFALGTLGYELLTGQRAFDGGTDLATLERIRTGVRTPIEAHRPELPPAVVHIIDRCLELDPARRYQTAQEVVRAILEYLVEARTVVSHAELAEALAPHLPTRPPTGPISVDDALSLELEALLGEGGQRRGMTQAVPAPLTPGAVPGTISESRPITATGRAQAEVDPIVPRSSRNRILITAIGLLVAVLLILNLTMLRELRGRDERTAAPPEVVGVVPGFTGARPEPTPASPAPADPRPAAIRENAEPRRVERSQPVAAGPGEAERVPAAERQVAVAFPAEAEEAAQRAPHAQQGAAPRKRHPVIEAPAPTPPAPLKGAVKFRIWPASARISVDGVAVPNRGVQMELKLAEGKHTLRAWVEGGGEVVRGFEVRADTPTNLATIQVGP